MNSREIRVKVHYAIFKILKFHKNICKLKGSTKIGLMRGKERLVKYHLISDINRKDIYSYYHIDAVQKIQIN